MVQIVRSRKESPGRKGKKESPPRQWLQMPAPNSKARRPTQWSLRQQGKTAMWRIRLSLQLSLDRACP